MKILKSLVVILAVAALLPGCSTAPTEDKEAAGAAETTAQAGEPCPTDPDCAQGDTCSNDPFRPTTCWPTTHGPAAADVVTGPSSLLLCSGGTYALCFFSGPKEATGTNADNPPLPCVYDEATGHANCTCQAYTSGNYYVAIHDILNEGVYFDTVNTCGSDGHQCKNMLNCADPASDECQNAAEPPVCQYVNDQDPNNMSVSLMPDADLISTFSFAMSGTPNDPSGNYEFGSTPCDSGLYAGCMTAACDNPNGSKADLKDGDPVQCACPTYTGVFQVGQVRTPDNPYLCQPVSEDGNHYVWSASNNVGSPLIDYLKEHYGN